MKKRILATVLALGGLFSLISGAAFAICADLPLPIKDANGSTINMSTKTASDGSCSYYIDADSASNLIAAINSGVGTPGSNAAGTNVQTGGVAKTSEPTAVTDGKNAAEYTDAVGKKIILPYANPENFLDGTITSAMTGTTDTAVSGMGAQGSGVRVYVTGCVISNSHATQGTDVVLKDGSAGTVLWTFPAAANFGGVAFVFPTPIKTTANTGLFAANITTGSNTKVSCTGYKGA